MVDKVQLSSSTKMITLKHSQLVDNDMPNEKEKVLKNEEIFEDKKELSIEELKQVTGGDANVLNGILASPGLGPVLDTINPADIESMDVMKDASATAIYGTRGANGVIIVP